MERRLLRGIMNPAMLVAWATGLWLAVSGGWFAARWFLAKFTLVLILSGFQGVLTGWVRNTRRPVVYRVANELPTLLMIGIVILVIVQPF